MLTRSAVQCLRLIESCAYDLQCVCVYLCVRVRACVCVRVYVVQAVSATCGVCLTVTFFTTV